MTLICKKRLYKCYKLHKYDLELKTQNRQITYKTQDGKLDSKNNR